MKRAIVHSMFSDNSSIKTVRTVIWAIIGGSGTLWWLLMWCFPAWQIYFDAYPEQGVLFQFLIPDLIFFVMMAWITGVLIWFHRSASLITASLHVGGCVYAALYCITAWWQTGYGNLAAISMSLAMLFSCLMLSWEIACYRRSRDAVIPTQSK